MKRFLSMILVLALLAGFCAFSVSCGKEGGDDKKESYVEKPDLDALELSDYVRLGEYKGMTVDVPGADHEEEAVWDCVLENAEVISFPEGLVEYYESQVMASYEYYAEKQGVTLEEAFEVFGMSEAEIAEEAKETARDDLVLAAIIKAEGMELTEEEIDRLFDKYVQEYTILGYTEAYIKNNMRDLILEVMLYDKVMEFLLLNNTLDYGVGE